MYQKIVFIFIIFLTLGCSKDEPKIVKPSDKEKAMIIYSEAVKALNERDFFFASKKFSEAELILPTVEASAKSAIMASYCLYLINFYDEAITNLERYITKYKADKNMPYAHYLITLSYYEQILDEKKNIDPLLLTKNKIEFFLKEYPDTEYALDLEFKLDLVNNQFAAKELYIAKYYMQTQKWTPAINRLKTIINKYETTIFVEEALHRLVEIYYRIGLVDEAKAAASILGYNYNSSEWYKESYKVMNRTYKMPKKENLKKENGLIMRTIKKLLNK